MSVIVKIPSAEVLEWNSSNLRVRCPYCDKVHRHGLPEYEERPRSEEQNRYGEQRRVAHCGTKLGRYDSNEYSLVFPLGSDTIFPAYEIDKLRVLYVKAGARHDTDVADLFHRAMHIEEPPKFGDATETRQVEGEVDGKREMHGLKVIDDAVAACVTGDVKNVKRFVENSKDARIFLQGVDESNNTALLLAAAEESSDMVKFLIDKRCHVNARNNEGCTPLMQAALWGRLDNVILLLEAEARPFEKDNEGHEAIGFARPDVINDERRSETIYKEQTYLANLRRRRIVQLLEQYLPTPADTNPLRTLGIDFSQYSFHKSGETSSIVLSAPLTNFPVEYLEKTIATLYRSPMFPLINARSGWGHHAEDAVISGRIWTQQVLRLAETINYRVAFHERDRRIPGRFHASHSEAQLIAYFIDKHVLREDVIDAYDGLGTLSGEEAKEHGRKLHTLLGVFPSRCLTKATILASTRVCDECIRFAKAVNDAFGLNLTLIWR
ncbi:hypothetical protein H2203_002724 [Taxawa tesnikishii (nom. ined.)]|nr:hypothetical protein H2203_002724 [Dothideales sp. JES 119]